MLVATLCSLVVVTSAAAPHVPAGAHVDAAHAGASAGLQAGAAVAPEARKVTRHVTLADGADVTLELVPTPVVSERTRFVRNAEQSEFGYDFRRVRALRGTVKGEPHSHAFVIASPTGVVGYVQRASGRQWLKETGTGPAPAETRRLPAGLTPGTPLCGAAGPEGGRGLAAPAGPGPGSGGPPTTRVVELAIETDYEFFSLIGDVDAAADYVVSLYAAVSDIYQRDLDVRLELTFVRLWDRPDDLFNDPSPLNSFRDHWNEKMADVPRDVAQFLSGRRDLPWGGIAYVGALCGSFAYSVVGYALGFFPDLSMPSVYHFDVPVTAHELGHNLGTFHTHDYGVDNCIQLDNDPQRGTIMSYCSQTVSGGNAVTDLRFDTVTAGAIRAYVPSAGCLHADCDGDGVDDAVAVAEGLAADVNGNGRPDACEDCNGNGVLDPEDIASGASTDLYLDGVPDECETDCDGDGVSDYVQIQADLSLDLNRDAVLDACQDCDGDGVSDVAELAGAWDAWVATHHDDGAVRRMHAVSGGLSAIVAAGAVDQGNDLVITPSGRVLVTSGGDDRVVELDRSGAVVGDFVPAGTGGLDEPAGILFVPGEGGGHVYVASRGGDAVLRFDGGSGAFLGAFVAPGAGGLAAPFGLARDANGDLYVNGADGAVRRYDGATGAFLGVFVAPGAGGLTDPRGMLFLPSGDLVVASRGTNAVLRYDGATGAFLGQFNQGGTTEALTFDEPWGLRIGPNGSLYGVRHDPGEPTGLGGGLLHGDMLEAEVQELHVNASRVYEFDVETGIFIRSYVTGHDTGLWAPTGFDFMPDTAVDCNRNNLPDACDIAQGRSADVNGNGVPDECETVVSPDLDGDGEVDGADLGLLLSAWGTCPMGEPCPADLSGDGMVDGADLGALLAAWGV